MDPYIGEIRLFAGTFAPAGWAFCRGQILEVRQYQTLFSVIGNKYGGDGANTFALPDLSATAPMHQGTGPGLTPRPLGSKGGSSTVTLKEDSMPSHVHLPACQTTGTQTSPTDAVWANSPGSGKTAQKIYSQDTGIPMNPSAIQATGGGQPHNNMQPYMLLNFIIALEGIYPIKP